MPAETNDQGWILHSHGQGRKFGPLTEDELRNYFRAGMVKSVDRLTPPGETAKHAAADVAAALGETVPVGPPPPPEGVEAPRAPPPPMPERPMAPSAAGPTTPPGADVDADAEARLARAMAAMNIDLSIMSAAPPKKQGLGLMGPLLLALMLVVMLVIGLNMLRKMRPPIDTSGSGPVASMTPDSTPVMEAQAPPPPAPEPGPLPAEPGQATEPATPAADDAASQGKAQAAGYLGQGNYPDAEVALKKVLASSPNDREARSMLAQVYQQSQRFDEAAALYKQMTLESPNDAIAWNNYGASLAGSGQPAQAVVALENAVRIDPTMKAAWTNLGNLYQQTGDSTKAKAAFANAR